MGGFYRDSLLSYEVATPLQVPQTQIVSCIDGLSSCCYEDVTHAIVILCCYILKSILLSRMVPHQRIVKKIGSYRFISQRFSRDVLQSLRHMCLRM